MTRSRSRAYPLERNYSRNSLYSDSMRGWRRQSLSPRESKNRGSKGSITVPFPRGLSLDSGLTTRSTCRKWDTLTLLPTTEEYPLLWNRDHAFQEHLMVHLTKNIWGTKLRSRWWALINKWIIALNHLLSNLLRILFTKNTSINMMIDLLLTIRLPKSKIFQI